MAYRASRRIVIVMVMSLLALALAPGTGLWRAAAQSDGFACPAPSPVSQPEATPGSAPVSAIFPAKGGSLTVFAAASLTDAFQQVKQDLEREHPNLTITFNFGGSQALVTQLGEGARADVFASANVAQMNAAVGQESIAGEPVIFARNLLAIVVPAANPAGVVAPADLGKPGLRLVLAQPEVPAGRYAREAICAMGADPAVYGDQFVEHVAANVVSDETDVRGVLTKVQLGEADAGIVYVTDAKVAGDAVEAITIPDEVNEIAAYPIAAVSGGDEALAEAFIAYLLSEEGQATLRAFGFAPAV